MTLTIDLKPETEAKLKNRAVALGYGVGDYVEKLIEEDSERMRSIDEIFAPLHKEVKESGISDAELDELFTQARREYFAEKKAKETL
jgi:hypothetical protein